MEASANWSQELNRVLNGDAWYSSNVYDIVNGIDFEAAYERPPGGAHSIAEIVLHMTGWTEEVIRRMQGNKAALPPGGDWPNAGAPDEEKWQRLKQDFKLMNVTLTGIVERFPEEKWNEPTRDERNNELGTGVTYAALINGLIQHHVYHSGQIALLKRVINS
ncbi:DinB family protein [Mucilaginibacter limnophilus]|uniref:DinB family protein n=1 Tax=Mucilaginibacter limnophilus TaxID=1932778 RepID=A0A3S2V6F5_9SPHI|nr:DinB family protein [Mucilaginibacter limnophilus]RVT98284.1 DinB family protein [Mucilaginibacter limnophilus]